MLGGQRPGAGQPAGVRTGPPAGPSTAPGPSNGSDPAVLAACIRRASSYSTTANAPANTSTSAVGRSPANNPIPGRSPPATPVARAHRSTTSGEADPSAPIARGSTTVCWSTVVLLTRTPHRSNTCTNTIKGG